MKALFNTTFFFPPSLAASVLAWLRDSWMPLCVAESGSAAPMLLELDPEGEGSGRLCRMAVQLPFPSETAVSAFLSGPGSEALSAAAAAFGPDNLLVCPSVMRILEP